MNNGKRQYYLYQSLTNMLETNYSIIFILYRNHVKFSLSIQICVFDLINVA